MKKLGTVGLALLASALIFAASGCAKKDGSASGKNTKNGGNILVFGAFRGEEAARFIHIAHERGLYIPDDIKVIGFDDIDIASYMELSSVSQSLDESGYLAADLVLKRLKDPRKKPSTKFAAVKVIERGSTSRKF